MYIGKNGGYFENYELGCAVCSTTRDQGAPYVRWGALNCGRDQFANTTEKPAEYDPEVQLVYRGFMANSQLRNDNHRSHKGGANFVCMHSEPQFPEDFDPKHNDGSNYMYGVEFGCHGGLNPPRTFPGENEIHDRSCGSSDDYHAACVVCVRSRVSQVYTQWGRTSCWGGHQLEYTGIIMASSGDNRGVQYRSEYICVDPRREGVPRERYLGALHDCQQQSGDCNPDTSVIFPTEIQGGSGYDNSAEDDNCYEASLESGISRTGTCGWANDMEISCAVCSIPGDDFL